MAIDNTPPRLKLIATIAVITVVTLISLDFVFKSYYAMMTDEAQHEKVAPTRDKDEQHKAEAAALTNASMPIDQAMALLAKGDRPEAITPNPSDDLAPLTGWSKLPKQPPPPAPHAAEPPATMSADGGAPLGMSADGGAPLGMPLATDAGAPPHVTADAGALAPRRRAPAPTPQPPAPPPN